MRLLSAIMLILLSAVDRLGDKLSMRNTITAQLVRHDLPGFSTVASQQSPEEAFRSCPIALRLKLHVHYLSVLIHGSPQVMMLAADLNDPAHRARGNGENFIDVGSITIASMLSL